MSRSTRAIVLPVLALTLALGSACTVRPLYSDNVSAGAPAAGTSAELASIAIKPIPTRYGQEVRNHLIFMFGGGAGKPTAPRYSLALSVTSVRESAATRQVSRGDNEPTAATVTLTGSYILTRSSDASVVGQGRRQITSSFDVPRQAFAEMRAERDAQDRAARELAALLRLAIAQNLPRG